MATELGGWRRSDSVVEPGKPGTPNVRSDVVSVDVVGDHNVPWEKATRSAGLAVRQVVVDNVVTSGAALALYWNTGAHGECGQGRQVVAFASSVLVSVGVCGVLLALCWT